MSKERMCLLRWRELLAHSIAPSSGVDPDPRSQMPIQVVAMDTAGTYADGQQDGAVARAASSVLGVELRLGLAQEGGLQHVTTATVD